MQRLMKQYKGIFWLTVVGLVVAAVVWLQPDDTSTTAAHRYSAMNDTTSTPSTDVEDDESAHFPRYVGTSRDPFIPKVLVDNPQAGGPGSLVNGGKWALTGINSVNGVTSALIESSAADQSVFLQVGDHWSGLRVVSITDDAVNFVNALGQVTQLGFASPDDATTGAGAMLGSNAPSLNQINPLPPLSPGAGSQPFASYSRNGSQQ